MNEKKAKRVFFELLKRDDFLDFFAHSEDKWLSNANWKDKVKAFYGSYKKTIDLFKVDEIWNKDNQ
jgi:hypothetical protein